MDTPKTSLDWRNAIVDHRIASIARCKGPEGKDPLLGGIVESLARLGPVCDWMVPGLLEAAVETWEAAERDWVQHYYHSLAQASRGAGSPCPAPGFDLPF